MPGRSSIRNRRQPEDTRMVREYSNYVRTNQRMQSQILEAILNTERNLFSLISHSDIHIQPNLNTSIFNPIAETPLFTSESWSLFSAPPMVQRLPLTLTEIDTATQYIIYGSIPLEQRRYPTCPITMNSFEDNTIVLQIQGCGHYFTPTSLRTHLIRHDNCPYCRFNIRDSLLEVVGTGISTSGNAPAASRNTTDASRNTTDASGNTTDASGNTTDVSGNTTDASGNTAINALNASVFYQIANNLPSGLS